MKVYILTVGYRYEDETFESVFSSFKNAKEYLANMWPEFTIIDNAEDSDGGFYRCGNLEMSIFTAELDPVSLPLHKE
jgi:hypothetical protein